MYWKIRVVCQKLHKVGLENINFCIEEEECLYININKKEVYPMHTTFRVVSHICIHINIRKKKPNVFVTLLKKIQNFNKEARMRKTKVLRKFNQ